MSRGFGGILKKILDLFCGAGGASMGYHRAGFEIVGVDINPQPHYPFEFHQADALTYPLEGFDAYHASPPCQAWAICVPKKNRLTYPQLINPIRERLKNTGKPYIIENVPLARNQLINPICLCGTQFGLNLWRHRYFEVYPEIQIYLPPHCHRGHPIVVSGWSSLKRDGKRFHYTLEEKSEAMGINWMDVKELSQSIPPAYTEYIGKKLIFITLSR